MDFTPATPCRIGFKMIFAMVVGVASLFAMVYAQPTAPPPPRPSPEPFARYPDYHLGMGEPGFRHYYAPDARSNPPHGRMVPRQSFAAKPS